MYDVEKMLAELGDGNEFTRKFLNDIRVKMSLGWKLTDKMTGGIAKCYYREFNKQPPMLGATNVEVEEKVFCDEKGRIYFKPFSSVDNFLVTKVDDERIYIHPMFDGPRKSKKDNSGNYGYHSLLMTMEIVIMKRKPSSTILEFQRYKDGLIVDLSALEECDYFKELTNGLQ